MADIFGPQGITIGSFTIYYYGILIVIGILVCAGVASGMAKRAGKDPDHIWGGLTWALIPALIGARLWFVLFPAESVVAAGHGTYYMLTHPFDLEYGPFAIRYGGLGIWGAVIGGLFGIYLYWRRHREEPLLEWLDIVIVVLPLGQAIGRWGTSSTTSFTARPPTSPGASRFHAPPAWSRTTTWPSTAPTRASTRCSCTSRCGTSSRLACSSTCGAPCAAGSGGATSR
ncbi:MAG: prolipoprotein diacylglyceryl transferase [Anaerolineae bacterium]|nr:prolipoprotein diacylglyceryl transferase [Anaerolineae bacterium]